MGRYVRHLTQWLQERGAAYDALYCDAIREEAMAVVEAGRRLRLPTVLQLGGWGDNSDTAWWPTSRASRRVLRFARLADRVIVNSAASHRALLSEGIDASQLVRIDRGFAAGGGRTADARAAARRALVTANGDLATATDTPVIVCVGRMTAAAGMNQLAENVRFLVQRFPDLRVWFLGDGPHRETLYSNLRGDGVRASIAMPGSFVDLQDVLAAADLYVQTDHDGLDSFLPAAVSAELPVVMLDDTTTRDAVHISRGSPLEAHVSWFTGRSSKPLRDAIRYALENLPTRREGAAALRRSLTRQHPLSESIESHVRLFEQLTPGPAATLSRSPKEAS